MPRRMNGHFNVAPRYTPGSPAMVDERIALRVAMEERDAYPYAFHGMCGLTDREIARAQGLDGIVECRVEQPGFWVVTDMITGKVYVRHMESVDTRECRHCGARKPTQRSGARSGRRILEHTRHSPVTGDVEPCPGGVEPRQHEVVPDSSYWKFRYQL